MNNQIQALGLMGNELARQIVEAAEDSSEVLCVDSEEISIYAAQRAQIVSGYVDTDEFEQVVKLESENLAVFAAAKAVQRADELDAAYVKAVKNALIIGARMLKIVL